MRLRLGTQFVSLCLYLGTHFLIRAINASVSRSSLHLSSYIQLPVQLETLNNFAATPRLPAVASCCMYEVNPMLRFQLLLFQKSFSPVRVE